jgi:hypothetical protein
MNDIPKARYDAERHNHEQDNQFLIEERDRYKTALEKIATWQPAYPALRDIAREALQVADLRAERDAALAALRNLEQQVAEYPVVGAVEHADFLDGFKSGMGKALELIRAALSQEEARE